tara:strand:+ start:3840 stop:4454 length:615 start_codon:yes stop_codon:yes gene_type:complete
MDLDFPEELILKKNNNIINEVLKKKVSITIENIILEEDYENNISKIMCMLNFHGKSKKKIKIEAQGNGVVDAFFNAIFHEFADNFVSLKNVKLDDFIVKVQFKKSKKPLQTDAPVEIKIVLENTTRKKIYFKCRAGSLVQAATGAICQAVTHLINAELAVIQLHKDIMNAQKRQRPDLVSDYTSQLVELVKTVSYSSVIEKETK